MAASYGRDGIRVNAICPGTIRTRLTADIVERVERAAKEGRGIPLRRVGEPEDIARCALFLASDDAAFVSGATLVADGGATAAYCHRRLLNGGPRRAPQTPRRSGRPGGAVASLVKPLGTH